MRALRAVLAVLLAAGPVRAEPVAELLSRYSVARDESAASAPEGDAPPGSGRKLAALESDLSLVVESLEGFAHPDDAEKALAASRSKLPAPMASVLRDRASSLDALYRTLAVVDYTWAGRFPEPDCSTAAARAALLQDALFNNSDGTASEWLTVLLGPEAEGKTAERALDEASSSRTTEAEYAELRARHNRLTKAIAESAREERAKLYCARAEVRQKLAAAAGGESGHTLAARAKVTPVGVVLLARKVNDIYSVGGAAVLIETEDGARLLTDSRLGGSGLSALARDGHAPVELEVVREDSGLLLLKPAGDLGPGLPLAEKAPATGELVYALAHSETLGAWTRTSGVVVKSEPALFLTDAVADASMTGGAILDSAGRVAGVLVLRPSAAEGRVLDWPAAIPATALSAWLAGAKLAPTDRLELEDAGTTRILTASRPLLDTVPGTQAMEARRVADFTQSSPWGSYNVRCVSNCDLPDDAPSSGYSGNGGAEIGQALGKALAPAVEALLFKGIPALFRGIASLFKSKPRATAQHPVRSAPLQRVAEKKSEPPKIACRVEKVGEPAGVGAGVAEFKVRISCDSDKVALEGHKVYFTLGWEGQKVQYEKIERFTDANGYASLKFQVFNTETSAERSLQDLKKEEWKYKDAPLTQTSPAEGPVNAASAVAPDKAAAGAVAADIVTLKGVGKTARAVVRFIPKGTGIATAGEVTVTTGLVAGAVVAISGAALIFSVKYALDDMIAAQDKYNEAIDSHRDDKPKKKDKFAELDEESERKCLPATPENIRIVASNSTMLSLQPRVSAPGVQSYVDLIETGVMPAPIKVSDDSTIVDGNHRYIAGLLCKIEVDRMPYPAPSGVRRYPISSIEVSLLRW